MSITSAHRALISQVTAPCMGDEQSPSPRSETPTAAGDLSRLLRPDGSVIVPAAIAREVLRALTRDLTARVRADGGEVSPGARRLLYALHAAAEAHDRAPVVDAVADPMIDTETVPPAPGTVEITATDAAGRLGCSAQYMRTLIRAGRVSGRRAGARLWLVDVASLDAYRTGGTDAYEDHGHEGFRRDGAA